MTKRFGVAAETADKAPRFYRRFPLYGSVGSDQTNRLHRCPLLPLL